MAPLADAVRFVDDETRDRQAHQRLRHARAHQPLRRHVKEPQLAGGRRAPVGDGGVAFAPRMNYADRGAERLQMRDLVVHQCDQRRDDDGEPVADERRQLIAKALPGAGRHDRQRVAPGDQRGDNFRLSGAKIIKAENRFERFMRRHRDHARRAVVTA